MSQLDLPDAGGGATPVSTPTPTPTPRPQEERAATKAEPASGEPTTEAGGQGDGQSPTSTPKRRRRGSRGGRNRNRARTQATGDDWTDPAADRGMTVDDLAEQAREDAGLERPKERERPEEPGAGERAGAPQVGDGRPTAAVARPKIGDTRPAPEAPAETGGGNGADGPPGTAKKRRRRRGGRGRGRGAAATGAATPAGSAAPAAPPRARVAALEYVEGVLGETDVDGTEILESLDDETLERRRGRTRKGRPAGRYLMVVHVRPDEFTQIAVLEGRTLVEHYVSRPEDDMTSIDGNIYLGRVQNVLPGMEAAFVDIGTPKNGVIYRGDVAFDESDVEGGERPRIERMLRNGQSVIVQVTKNPIGHKGARLTQEVSLAGRFVVMVPGQPQTYGISKRLPDDERKRLRRILDGLRPDDAGLIVRTAAEGATADELERDLRRLKAQWEQISEIAKKSKPGRLLYKEPPLALRVIREEFTKEYRGVAIDDRELYDEVKSYLDAVAPELAERLEHYDADEENLPIFERFHVHEQLQKALDRKVWLPSGGSLVIERTEALTVIDVNTGKNVGKSNLEETVYRNNLEAAEVLARELRLRDIGGIIVIDFIDMESKRNREDVERALREALARDKTRTQIFAISELGLVEMTRKRVSEGLVEAFSETCDQCSGRGFVVDESMLD